MGRTIDYEVAREELTAAFELAEEDFREGRRVDVPEVVKTATAVLFDSNTQAFREAAIGCCLARIIDPHVDIRLPYMNQGDDAYNGRTLDENVVNPFLKEREIPSSKGPFLSVFRRNIGFVPETAKGLRDRDAFGAMLAVIDALLATDQNGVRTYLRYLLTAFVDLRDRSKITLSRINRLSIDQYSTLMSSLLATPSGGLIPVLLAVATFNAIRETYALPWEIEFQGINVADAASGAGGDITVKRDGQIIISVEVTERPIDNARVRSTFATKISPNSIDDYLFFYSAAQPTEEARAAARAYFAQGHEINFVAIKDWIMTILTTLGAKGRVVFTDSIINLLDQKDVPAAIKVAWNDNVRAIVPT
jgi:hypothetical protein